MTEPLACYSVVSKLLDQDPHTTHHPILCSLPGQQICMCYLILKAYLTTCKVQQQLQDQAGGEGIQQGEESMQLAGRDAQIELPTNQVGRSRGAEGRRRGRGGREGGVEVSWQEGECQGEVARGRGGGVGGDGRSGMSWELGGRRNRICLHFQAYGSQGMTWLTQKQASTDLWTYSSAGTASPICTGAQQLFQTDPPSPLPASLPQPIPNLIAVNQLPKQTEPNE